MKGSAQLSPTGQLSQLPFGYRTLRERINQAVRQ